jgi:riboflavin transporter FmnP
MNRNNNFTNVKKLAGAGIFAALAIAVSFATSFIKIGYLSLDAGDIIIVLASFIYGPGVGVAISLVSAMGGFMYSGTMWWGALMDFVSSAVFAFTASFVYSRRKTFNFAIIGIYSAVVAVTAIMMPMNILITPLYMPVSIDFVIKEIPRMLLPFNFAKATFNGGMVLLLYKPLVRALRRGGFASSSESSGKTAEAQKICGLSKNTFVTLVLGGVSVILAIVGLIILSFK